MVSIIIPVYKVEKYLQRCVWSILNQSLKALEVILVDDGSPDGCPKLCDDLAEQDARVKVIHQENGGVSSARNAGLAVASGEYIGFIDADDWIEPDMYEVLLKKMLEEEVDVVQCGYCTDEGQNSGYWSGMRENRKWSSEECLRALVCGDMRFSSLWNKLYRASLFEGVSFSTKYRCFEDALVNYQLFKRIESIYLYETCLYHYVRHASSALSRLEPWRLENIFSFYTDLIRWETGGELLPYCEKGLVDSCFSLIGGIIREKRCQDQYAVLRFKILEYRDKILSLSCYSPKDRWKLRLLEKCPGMYQLLIKIQRRLRKAGVASF